MMVRLNDRLQVTEKQKTEITSLLFTFIKNMIEDQGLEVSTPEIITAWLKYTKKTKWVEEKLNDIEFLAGICEFVEKYKSDIASQDVNQYNILYKI